jgi:hypothetical protein
MVDLGAIMRGEGARYVMTHRTTFQERKAIRDIADCRTAAMGSVTNTCQDCKGPYRLHRSCRNRSCPLCQGEKRRDWLEARRQELLRGSYLQMVFGNPGEFRILARYCPAELYGILFRAAAQAVIDVGRLKLQAQLGCLGQMQTWTQLMACHVHIHFVVPCGGFSDDGSRWIAFEPKAFPTQALRRRFRSLLCKYVRVAARRGKFAGLPATVSVDQLVAKVQSRELRVYVAPPFGGPEKLLQYLAQYMYRVAITNDRIESYDQHQVTFRWRDYRDGGAVRRFTIKPIEFVERFLPHLPPKGFVRVRSFGFLGNRNRKHNLERARQLIGQAPAPAAQVKPARIRLCASCIAAKGEKGVPHFAPLPDLRSQLVLPLRAPPKDPVAA